MLDFSHPMAVHVLRASTLMEGLLTRAQEMSVSSRAARSRLLPECLRLIHEMKDLARSHFGGRVSFILATLDEYEARVRDLEAIGDGEGNCPHCGTPFARCRPLPDDKDCYFTPCEKCDGVFILAHQKLETTEGFGTWAI